MQSNGGSESDILNRAIAAAAAEHPEDRILCIVDRRSSSAAPGLPRYIVATIAPASPWHELLPPTQIAEIRDRERSRE